MEEVEEEVNDVEEEEGTEGRGHAEGIFTSKSSIKIIGHFVKAFVYRLLSNIIMIIIATYLLAFWLLFSTFR